MNSKPSISLFFNSSSFLSLNCTLNYSTAFAINSFVSINQSTIEMSSFKQSSAFNTTLEPAASSVVAVPITIPKDDLTITCNAKLSEIAITASGEDECMLKVGATQTSTLDAVDLDKERPNYEFKKVAQITSRFQMSKPSPLVLGGDNTPPGFAITISDSGHSGDESYRESSVETSASSVLSHSSGDKTVKTPSYELDDSFISFILAKRRAQKKVIQKPVTNHPFFRKLAEGPVPKPKVVVKPMLVVPNPLPSLSSPMVVLEMRPANPKSTSQNRVSKRQATPPLRTGLKPLKHQRQSNGTLGPSATHRRSSLSSNSSPKSKGEPVPKPTRIYPKIDFSYRIPKYSKLNSKC